MYSFHGESDAGSRESTCQQELDDPRCSNTKPSGPKRSGDVQKEILHMLTKLNSDVV